MISLFLVSVLGMAEPIYKAEKVLVPRIVFDEVTVLVPYKVIWKEDERREAERLEIKRWLNFPRLRLKSKTIIKHKERVR